MGGSENEDQPLQRSLKDEGRTPPGVVEGVSKVRGSGGSGVRDVRIDGGRDSYRYGDIDAGKDGGGDGRGERGDGDLVLAEGGGSSAGGLPGGACIVGGHMADGGPDTQGSRGLLRNRSSGGGVEGSDGDSQLPLQILHRLPQHPS